MRPDYEKAAIKATEILIKYQISTAPIFIMPILTKMPNTLVLDFSEISNLIDLDRKKLVTLFGLENQDAVTSVRVDDGRLHYLVAYNQQLPFNMLQRSLARELGHIVMEHDDSVPEEIRTLEAKCFSKHLLCPRALIHEIQQRGEPLTVEAVGCVTGCYGRCQALIRTFPGVHVPADMNRQVKEQFADYIDNFISYQKILVKKDTSPLADFGTYMDGYEE